MMIGAYVGGIISDRFGRRIIFLGGMLFTSAFAFMSCFSVNFVMFFILRLVSGIGKIKFNRKVLVQLFQQIFHYLWSLFQQNIVVFPWFC